MLKLTVEGIMLSRDCTSFILQSDSIGASEHFTSTQWYRSSAALWCHSLKLPFALLWPEAHHIIEVVYLLLSVCLIAVPQLFIWAWTVLLDHCFLLPSSLARPWYILFSVWHTSWSVEIYVAVQYYARLLPLSFEISQSMLVPCISLRFILLF